MSIDAKLIGASGGGSAVLDPTTTISIIEDFTWGNQSNTPSGPFGLVPTGSSGGGLFNAPNTAYMPILNRWGVLGFGLGTNNNNTSNAMFFSDLALIYPGQALTSTLQFSIYTPLTLSDGTNEYVMDFGFRDSFATNAQAANAMCISYNRTISTNWMAYTANNSTVTNITTADASLAVNTGTWWDFKIVMVAGSVSFYAALPGATSWTLIGTSSTNLPDNTHRAFMTGMIYRTTTYALQRMFGIDYMKLDMTFNSAR